MLFWWDVFCYLVFQMLIWSSVSSNLLLTPSSTFFISDYLWFPCPFSVLVSSLLAFSLNRSILPLSSLNIFITSVLNFTSGRLFASISFSSFSRDFSFHLRHASLSPHFGCLCVCFTLLSVLIYGTSFDLVHALMGKENCYTLFNGGSYYTLRSISGGGSSIEVKSAVLLDLEFQCGIPFIIPRPCLSVYLYFFWGTYLFPYPLKTSPAELLAVFLNSCFAVAYVAFLPSHLQGPDLLPPSLGKLWAQRLDWMVVLDFHCPLPLWLAVCLSQLLTVNSLRAIAMSYPFFFP